MLKATVSTRRENLHLEAGHRIGPAGRREMFRRADLDWAGRSLDTDAPDSGKRQAGGPDRAIRMLFPPVPFRELADETGTPVLYADGQHYDHGDGACLTFPDQRWLKFPVRHPAGKRHHDRVWIRMETRWPGPVPARTGSAGV